MSTEPREPLSDDCGSPARPAAQPLLPLGEPGAWQRPRREWAVRGAVFALLALLFLPNVGAFGLWDPWETHYGEVTRNMVESYDWLNPWWGYRTKIGPEGKQGAYFYSKPILIFWGEAVAVRLIGFSEWAIRLPMALFGLFASFFAYYALSKIWSRRLGLLAALAMATSPQFFCLARQAQTDMMFVAPLAVGMIFLLLAFFGPWEGRVSTRSFLLKYLFTIGVFLLAAVPQFVLVATDLQSDRSFDELPLLERLLNTVKWNGLWHAVLYGLATLLFLVWFAGPVVWRLIRRRPLGEELQDRALRDGYLLVFVVMAGLATLGKGLLGFCLPGAVVFVYLLLTNRWSLLRVFAIPRSLIAFLVVALPWYVAMFVKHGNAFYTRFFVHDHFNRLGSGVHQIDSGTFDHFLKWLGVGIYPWVALVPLAIFMLSRLRLSDRSRSNQFNLLVFVWFFVAYLLFTLSKTQFHHYIFPALPPFVFLIARSLIDLLGRPSLAARAGALVAVLLHIGLTYNLARDPQLIRNLFTYKYDRPLPEHFPLDSQAPATEEPGAKCAADSECGPHEVCLAEGSCSTRWEHTQFYSHTTDSVKWLLNQPWLAYDNVVWILGIGGGLALLLLFFVRLRGAANWLLVAVGLFQTLWGLNYYLPSLSASWSQKNVFEDYYDLCGEDLRGVEEEAYEPLIRKLGLEGLYAYFQSTAKRVCPYQITSWLIVWRGETYYSYNELMPLEKKNTQLGPYLEEMNPMMQELPESCPLRRQLCPRKFFVFMENRTSNTPASVASGVNTEVRRIQKDSASPAQAAFQDIDRFDARRVSNENDFFTLFEAIPVYRESAPECSCRLARIPPAVP